MQGTQQNYSHASLKRESVWFKTKLISQFLSISFILTQPFYLSYLHAAPAGGNVVGGTGSISQSDLTTTINQSSQNLAVNWQSFDVKTNEKVNFVQPNSSSIAFNRILGNNGSVIQGQINANGQIILVNPNGVFFTPTATINVGGIVASSLDMTPSDFMNGNYIFNEVIGADGAVINSGIINASLGGDSSAGGNVTLIGKQVKNTGLITANLGSVVLAAGKQSILTFDSNGLIGVTVTKEVLQDELGLEEAVINSGDINAAGGRVLLTASVSQDVFSQAVNNGVLDQATSVVVNDDGTFTLGGGADVLNTGSIDVSSETNSQNTARIILLGENITSSGSIKADTQNGNAGEIEVHAKDKTLLTQNSITSAQAISSGQGGLIKFLGDKVGLFEQSQVNASGANGGGDVLIGGDRQGLNSLVRNANYIYLGGNSTVNADATENGNGGKIIAFAKDTARIHGGLFARGGSLGGNGGFIETSGLVGFNITNAPDVSATNGFGGLWLIDPNNIRIVNDGVITSRNINTNGSPFRTSNDDAILEVGFIESVLNAGNNVEIETRSRGTDNEQGSISFEANLDFEDAIDTNSGRLRLLADRDINFTNGSSITSSNTDTNDRVNIELNADYNNDGLGNIDFNGTTINTYGGYFTVLNARNITSSINASTITTQGGNFTVNQGWNYNNRTVSFNSGLVTLDVASGNIDLDGINGAVTLGNVTENGGGNSFNINNATSIAQASGTIIDVLDTGQFGNTANTTSISLENTTNNFSSVRLRGGSATIQDINGINLSGGTNLSSLLDITTGGNITDSGSVVVSNGSNNAVTNFDTTGSVVIDGNNDDFNRVNFKNASSVDVTDDSGGIAIAANNRAVALEGGVTGNLTIRAIGGDITSSGEVNAGISGLNVSSFTVDDGQSIYLANSNNTFNGNVNFNVPDYGDGDRINNITFTDDTALILPDIDITGNLVVTGDSLVFSHTHINTGGGSGLFSATTTNASGSITQNNTDITVSGSATTTLNATGNITLTDSNNDFNGVTITNGNIVSLRDTNSLSLLSSSTSGNLTVQAGGDISLIGNISTNNNAATNAGNVDFLGNIRLAPSANGGTITIDTNAAGALQDGSITFNNNINNNNGNSSRNNLNLVSGDGAVDIKGSIGNLSNREIASLVINNGLTSTATVNLGIVNLYGENRLGNALDVTAGIINLGNNINTDVGSTNYARGVMLNGDVVLGNNVTIDTSDSNSDGAITFANTINGANALTLDSESGAVDLQGSVGNTSALTALTINSGKAQRGTVNLNAVTTTGGNNVIRVDATTINLNGNINSNNGGAGGDIRFDGNLVLNNSITINSAGTGSNGQVDINGNINGNNALNSNSLTISAGDNAVNLNSIGNNEAIQQLSITNTTGDITVGSINTRDNTNTANDSGVVLTSTGTITLGGNISTNVIGSNGTQAGLVNINGAAVLNGDVIISTNAGVSAGTIDFSSTVNATTINNDLTINAGAATVAFNADIGNNQTLGSVVVNNAGTTSLNNVTTGSGGINITSGSIYLAGTLDTKSATNAGNITLSGNVNLNSTGTTVELNTNTNGAGNDANITINNAVNNATSKNLILDAGNADVSMTATAGAGTALQSLTVTGNNVSLGNVTSIDAIDVTANTTNSNAVINLSGSLITTGTGNTSDINLKQADVVLNGNTVLQVAAANNITVEGNINADLNTNNRNLTVNSGSGIVDFQGNVGLSANGAVQGLTVTTGTSGTVNLNQVLTGTGGINVTTTTLNLAGDLSTNDNANAGNIILTTDRTLLSSGITLNTNSTISDGKIDLLNSGLALGIDAQNNILNIMAGVGNVTANQNISNVRSFDLVSSGTSTFNDITAATTGGTITVNASNGLNLNGNYQGITSTSELMSFNADSDANGVGALNLGANSNFVNTTGPISFTGATLVANNAFSIRAGASGSDAVQFNATNDMSIGAGTLGFILNNTQLSNITASSIDLAAANDIYMSGVAQTPGPAYSLTAANDIISTGANSTFSSLTATAGQNFNLSSNITTVQDLSISASSINVSGIRYLRSNNSDILLTGGITGSNGYLIMNADNVSDTGLVSFGAGTNVNNLYYLYISADDINTGNNNISTTSYTGLNIRSQLTSGTYIHNGNIESVQGSVSINAGDNNLVLANGTSVRARSSVNLNTLNGNIGLSSVQSTSGTISVNAGNGRIYDNNGGATNITASNAVYLTATGGIGSGDPLEFVMNGPNARLITTNNGSGNIEIINSGAIQLDTVKNNAVGGTFELTSTGADVTIKSLIIDKTNPNSVAIFDVTGGDVVGVPGAVDTNGNIVHVTANSAIFQMNNTGSVGQLGSPLITDIPNKIEVISAIDTYIEFFGQVPPKEFIGDNAYKNRALQSIENLSGQQLIAVESLAEIDPAIFTDVRNYSYSDIALMMPSDQRYTDDEEEEDVKAKRLKLINSTP